MRRFISKITVLGLLVATSLLLLIISGTFYVFRQAQRKDTVFWMSHEVNVSRSIQKIQTIPSPRIILIGGSSVGMGINSSLLSDYFNMPVINTGTIGRMGLKLQIDFFSDYLTEDDIVLIMPEYNQFYGRYLGIDWLYRVLPTVPHHLWSKVSILQFVNELKYLPKSIKESSISVELNGKREFTVLGLNEYGDLCFPREHKDFQVFQFEESLDLSAVMKLSAIIKDSCSTIILFPPPYCRSAYDLNKGEIELIEQSLQKFDIYFSVNPERYVLADSLFYDYEFHLTNEGSDLYTEMIIEDLELLLNKTTDR